MIHKDWQRYQDWQDKYYHELFDDWLKSGKVKDFNNYCEKRWRDMQDELNGNV